MNTSFTPGPWEKIDAQKGWIIAANEGQYDICVVRNITGAAENAVNSRLIAASPDLYAALVALSDHMADAIKLGCDAGRFLRAQEQARAALAKVQA